MENIQCRKSCWWEEHSTLHCLLCERPALLSVSRNTSMSIWGRSNRDSVRSDVTTAVACMSKYSSAFVVWKMNDQRWNLSLLKGSHTLQRELQNESGSCVSKANRQSSKIIIMIIALKGATPYFFNLLTAPQSLQHLRSSGLGAIVCKSHATHQAPITCHMSRATWYKGQLGYLV